ncbi:MAG: sigma-70 family RNA polymerase sigma factor [Deltaproteobacteria bacterium]|nr:sigma-70 family RNA polymerase sigma factor [Deltaproteobacteria bacterium]
MTAPRRQEIVVVAFCEQLCVQLMDRDRERELGLVTQGDRPAGIAELYRAHGKQVTRWAARLAGPSLEVDDIVQEVFLVAHQQLATFRGDSQLSTWLFGITANVVRHRRRKERVRRWLMGLVSAEPVPMPSRPTPVEVLLRNEASATVYRALQTLPDKYRTPFVLFELEGLSGQQICELTGINPSTLRVHLLRARQRFAEAVRALAAKEPQS